jgi:hypothetical protein
MFSLLREIFSDDIPHGNRRIEPSTGARRSITYCVTPRHTINSLPPAAPLALVTDSFFILA